GQSRTGYENGAGGEQDHYAGPIQWAKSESQPHDQLASPVPLTLSLSGRGARKQASGSLEREARRRQATARSRPALRLYGKVRAMTSSGMVAPPIEKATYCLPPAMYVIGAPPAFAGSGT